MFGRLNARRANPKSGATDLGFKHVWAVRVWTGAGPTRYEVQGTIHRHPANWRVTAGMATRLAAGGVPVVIRERERTPADERC